MTLRPDDNRYRAMIVTMISMAVVKSTVDKIVDMIAMWHLLVTTFFVIASTGHWQTGTRIVFGHGEGMFVIVAIVRMMEMPIMQEINMTLMFHLSVSAVFAVDMFVA